MASIFSASMLIYWANTINVKNQIVSNGSNTFLYFQKANVFKATLKPNALYLHMADQDPRYRSKRYPGRQ